MFQRLCLFVYVCVQVCRRGVVTVSDFQVPCSQSGQLPTITFSMFVQWDQCWEARRGNNQQWLECITKGTMGQEMLRCLFDISSCLEARINQWIPDPEV